MLNVSLSVHILTRDPGYSVYPDLIETVYIELDSVLRTL